MNPSNGARTIGRTAEPPDEGYAALIRAVQAGHGPAMERLLMRAQEVAYRFSVTVCGGADDAEDAMQEALVKTFRYARRIREPEAFRTWLYRTVRNACLMGRRRRAAEPVRLLSIDELMPSPDGSGARLEPVNGGQTPEEIVGTARLRRRLRAAIARLPRQYRVILFLREIEGLSTREVAKIMGISAANVKTRLHRARVSLRRHPEGA